MCTFIYIYTLEVRHHIKSNVIVLQTTKMMSCDLLQDVDKPKGKHKNSCLWTWQRVEPGWADHLNRWFIRGVSITLSKIQHLFEPCSNTQQDSPGMSLQPLAGPEESGWEWDWDWQQGQERGPSPPSYGAPPPAPASPWPVDALAPPRPSSCPPPPSAWRCSRSGPWCFLCCCRLTSGESEDKEMSPHVALNSDGNTADVHKLTSLHRFGFLVRGGRLRHVIKGPGTLSTPETKTWESTPHHFTHSNTWTILTLSMRSFWTPNFPPNPLE